MSVINLYIIHIVYYFIYFLLHMFFKKCSCKVIYHTSYIKINYFGVKHYGSSLTYAFVITVLCQWVKLLFQI